MNDQIKTAIVTGASRGIGAAVARRLAQDGFAVAVNYAGQAAQAEEVVRLIEAESGRARDPGRHQRCGRSMPPVRHGRGRLGRRRCAGQQRRHHGAVHHRRDGRCSVRPAGRGQPQGNFNALREAARRLRPGGRIIGMSSSVVGLLQPTYGVYAATKAALEAMASVLAKEMRGRRVTVNAIAPGPTATDLFLHGKPPDLVDRLAKLAPLERLGEPADIASAASFLAGPDGAWVNGQTLRVNGGVV